MKNISRKLPSILLAASLAVFGASATAAPPFSIVVPKSPSAQPPGNQGQGQGQGAPTNQVGNCASPNGAIVLNVDNCAVDLGSIIATPGNSLSFGLPGAGLTAPNLEMVPQGFPSTATVVPGSTPFYSFNSPPSDSMFAGELRADFSYAGPVAVTGDVLIRNTQTGQGAKAAVSVNVYRSLFNEVTPLVALNANANRYYSFGSIATGSFVDRDILVKNNRNVATELMMISALSFGSSAQFVVQTGSSSCQVGTVLAPGQSCNVRLRATVPSDEPPNLSAGVLNVRDTLWSTIYQDNTLGIVANN